MDRIKLLWILLFTLTLETSAFAGQPEGSYVVLGVIASNAHQKGVALIKNRTNEKVSAVKVGDKVTGDIKLVEVKVKYIVMEQHGNQYKIEVGADIPNNIQDAARINDLPIAARDVIPSTEGLEKNGNTLKVNASLKEHIVGANLNKVLMQAATQPYMQDGKLKGFALWDIDEGSIYQIAGFQNGDIITHINGQQISDAGVAIRLLQGLKNATEADVQFLRGNSEQSLKIVIH